jgi:hypothetical protein
MEEAREWGQLRIFLSETMNEAFSGASTTDRLTSAHCQKLQLQRIIRHE